MCPAVKTLPINQIRYQTQLQVLVRLPPLLHTTKDTTRFHFIFPWRRYRAEVSGCVFPPFVLGEPTPLAPFRRAVGDDAGCSLGRAGGAGIGDGLAVGGHLVASYAGAPVAHRAEPGDWSVLVLLALSLDPWSVLSLLAPLADPLGSLGLWEALLVEPCRAQ